MKAKNSKRITIFLSHHNTNINTQTQIDMNFEQVLAWLKELLEQNAEFANAIPLKPPVSSAKSFFSQYQEASPCLS